MKMQTLILLYLSLLSYVLAAYALLPQMASPEVQSATMCTLVFPKYGELIPVNVDKNGNEMKSNVWVLLKCSFSTKAIEVIEANDGFMLIGTQQVEPSDFSIKNEIAYVPDRVKRNKPHFFLSSLQISVGWQSSVLTKKNLLFTVNTCHVMNEARASGCIELSRLHTIVVKATTQLLQGLQSKSTSSMMKIDNSNYEHCNSKQSRNDEDKYGICRSNNSDTPKNFDFMEVGTSAFGTIIEICKDYHIGISIEPISVYQDMLPDISNVHKLRFAVGYTDGYLPIYQFPKAAIDNLGYSLELETEKFLYGMAMLNTINPTQLDIARNDPENGDILHLIQRDLVAVKTIQSIYIENNIYDIKVIKLDCEGIDFDIILSAMEYFEKSHKIYPRIIVFESNVGDDGAKKQYEKVLVALHDKGYITHRYLYHISGTIENLIYVNSDIYAIHETSTQSDIEEYDYMFTSGMDDEYSRGLKHTIHICAPIIENKTLDPITRQHCNILTLEGQDKSTDVISADRCIAESCSRRN